MGVTAVTLGVVGAALSLVAVSFVHCGVAEFFVRVAASIYVPKGERRLRVLEEWLEALQQLQWRERPSHAGSLLWASVAHLPARVRDASANAHVLRLGLCALVIVQQDDAQKVRGYLVGRRLWVRYLLRPEQGFRDWDDIRHVRGDPPSRVTWVWRRVAATARRDNRMPPDYAAFGRALAGCQLTFTQRFRSQRDCHHPQRRR